MKTNLDPRNYKFIAGRLGTEEDAKDSFLSILTNDGNVIVRPYPITLPQRVTHHSDEGTEDYILVQAEEFISGPEKGRIICMLHKDKSSLACFLDELTLTIKK